ncbi:MAG TPA: hypothetical protein VMT52_05830 [Planctomycetota bacterium]|nr:hypothetical protein [Planctomycetota bacterium]
MDHMREHAIILGSAIVISVVIVLARTATLEAPVSAANPSSSKGFEPGGSPAGRLPARPHGPGTLDGGRDLSLEVAAGETTRALLEAQGLVKEAEELFQSSAGKEGRELELREAKKLLERAEVLLDAFPENNLDAKNLRRRASQLHSDLLRVSGFD